ncbi:MAG: tRNA (adenosine(37)-N6)-threonylcarbamoyltransferase complex dimerization subunit type 1 TsaB [Pseudomonadota bacterium]|jgi:tRNA threonylcarbamoyladenosine biosynthesis protein TsaB
MAVLLAIETSGDLCSVALGARDGTIERQVAEVRGHNRLLLPAIDQLLAESGCRLSQLDAIAVGVGPGSFTGLRIGVGVAQGLAFGAGVGVIAVSSLAALAQAGVRSGALGPAAIALTLIDARMGQVYWGLYQRAGGQVTALSEDRLDAPAAMAAAVRSALGTGIPVPLGNGWAIAGPPDFPVARPRGDLVARARDVLQLAEPRFAAGELLAPERLEPRYLRGSEHWRRRPAPDAGGRLS